MRPTHLTRRGAVYTVRFRLPADLASRLGCTELRKSLHTSDIAVARKRCLEATRWFRAEIERLRSMPAPTRADLEEAEGGSKTKSLKNKAAKRAVPIHPDLVALGLREFVESSK